jgi:2-oxoglutarate ferredoxin oxidoreductase subunit gamma
LIIRFAGFGGQGIVLSSYILGQAAVFDGKKALQNQSYGSESWSRPDTISWWP